ncbi:MAG: heme exporter protein CcmB [Planctomycetes bacterium]|nr:heme exporter protein CcmB [Planctomycetota bacterium]
MRALAAIVAKDLLTELRLRQVLPTMFVLALVLTTVFGLAAQEEVRRSPQMAAAALWLAFVFAGLLAVERAFASEKESRTMPALLAAPTSRQTLLAAKCVSSAVMLLAVQAVMLPIAVGVFEFAVRGPLLPLVGVLLAGDAALVILGTLTSAMVAPARVRGPLLSVLVLALLVPLMIFAAQCTAELAGYGWTPRAGMLLAAMAAADVVFGAAAYLLFPFAVES